jgi:hypothetical protein
LLPEFSGAPMPTRRIGDDALIIMFNDILLSAGFEGHGVLRPENSQLFVESYGFSLV